MRTDNVKPNSNPACESQRQVTKKCKKANHKKTLNNNNNHNNHKALEGKLILSAQRKWDKKVPISSILEKSVEK